MAVITPNGVSFVNTKWITLDGVVSPMSDDASIRRANLRSLRLDPTQLKRKAGRTYSYWRDLLQSDKKSFGEKVARSIEPDLGLPRGWLDQLHDPHDPTTNAQSPKGGHRVEGAQMGVVLAEAISVIPFEDPPTISWERVLSTEPLPPLFKLAMPDDALAPKTPRGTLFIFSTTGEPADGDLVLVRAATGRPYLRLHFDGAGDDWEVRSRDAAHPPLQRDRDGLVRLAVALFRAGGQG